MADARFTDRLKAKLRGDDRRAGPDVARTGRDAASAGPGAAAPDGPGAAASAGPGPGAGQAARDAANYPAAVNVTKPSKHTVTFLEGLDPAERPRCIAEIGIYRGHTSAEFARLLPDDGELHLYDFHETVEAVAADLRASGFDRVRTFGNTMKVLDSYNWSLMEVLAAHPEPIYDYVFIDGAHTWHHDGFAFLLVDKLLKPGGWIDFDDYHWTLGGSPTLKPEVFPKTDDWYTREQIDAKQVELVVDLLVRRDDRYEELVPDHIFRKLRA